MNRIHFKKTLKKITALALIAAVSYPEPVSATHVHSYAYIDEEDSFETVSSRGIRVEIRNKGRTGDQTTQEDVSYLLGVKVAKNDFQLTKSSLIASPSLSHPQSYEDHQRTFKTKIVEVYRETPLEDCWGDFYPQTDRISNSLFKILLHQLSKSHSRNEWSEDRGLQTFITFTRNKEGKLSVLIKGLDVALPLYKSHRTSHLDSLTPEGSSLTPTQKVTAQFMNRLLSEYSDAFRRGLGYRLNNPTKSLEDLFKGITGLNTITIGAYFKQGDSEWLIDQVRASCAFKLSLPRDEKVKRSKEMVLFQTQEGKYSTTVDALKFAIIEVYTLGDGNFDLGFTFYKIMSPAYSVMNQVRQSNAFETALGQEEKGLTRGEKIRRVRLAWDFLTDEGKKKTDVLSMKALLREATKLNTGSFDQELLIKASRQL